ncbi:solute carrier family 2, facilitated glucose transporter member 5-like isoform X2 [Crotalus tigris]|nr:solute carrier family 2, facilitated glucose transporter member 5-like isoform X2 [Crotalus tigris]
MQLLNLQYEGIDTGSVHFEFLILLSVFVPLGGIFGVYVWSCLADRYGRKCAVLIINGLSIFSSAILCFDNIVMQFEYSLFARFLAGMTSGAFSFSVPLYVLEISSLNLRGALVTTLVLFFSWGYILVQILISPQIWGSEEDFSLLAGVAAIFAVISIILLALSPESPRFLHIQRNDKEKARQVLKMLRGVEDVEEEMEELYQEHLAESSQKNMTVWKLLRFRSLRWQLITVVVLVSGSRFVQTNAVLIFVQQTYKVLGLSHKAMKLLPLVGSVVIQLMLLTTICTVESLGRRFLLLSGFLICCISNIALVFTFQVEEPSLAFISIVLIILFFMGYVTGPAGILPLIIGELFLQSSRASACVIAGFVSWGIKFISAILFVLTKKLTRPLVLSILGASLGFFQYGYTFFLITNPAVIKMQLVNLQNEGIDTGSVHFEFFILFSIFVPFGGLFGVYVWSCLADRYGRKCALLISNAMNVFLAAILCFDKIFQSVEFSLFARFLAGMELGMFSFSVPLYILEISSLNLRGALLTTLVFFFSWGYILVQILINPQIWGNEENYSLLVGVIAIFAILSSIFLLPSPESPRFLYMQRNDKEKARQVLKMLRGEEDVEEEMEELYQEHLAESSQKNMTVWKLLHFRSLRWHLITVVVLVSGTGFVQINMILIFAQQTYKVLGLSAKDINLLSLVGSLIIELTLLTTICTIESLGRRFLLLSGFLICTISNIALVFAFQVYSSSLIFTSIVLILFFMGYVTGLASVLPLIIGELFLQSSRVSACVIAGFVSWGANFISALLFLLTKSHLGSYYLLLYWPFMILTSIYIFWVVPETRGKTFQEIQESMAVYTSKDSAKITAE